MNLVSVLSTLHAPSATHLAETIQAVAAQKLPSGWKLEWVVKKTAIIHACPIVSNIIRSFATRQTICR